MNGLDNLQENRSNMIGKPTMLDILLLIMKYKKWIKLIESNDIISWNLLRIDYPIDYIMEIF